MLYKKKYLNIFIVALFFIGCSNSKIELKKAQTKDTSLIQDRAPDFEKNVTLIPDAKPTVYHGIKKITSYSYNGIHYTPMDSAVGYSQKGVASWYGMKFHGKQTANGEIYDLYGMTAAHKTLPLPSYVKVTNLENNRTVILRVNDRGPFVKDRIIDLSFAAAKKLGFEEKGTANVLVEGIDEALFNKKYESKITDQLLFIQISALTNYHNAQMLRKNLSEYIQLPIKVVKEKKDDLTLYKVRIGPVKTSKQLEVVLDELEKNQSEIPYLIYENRI